MLIWIKMPLDKIGNTNKWANSTYGKGQPGIIMEKKGENDIIFEIKKSPPHMLRKEKRNVCVCV